MAPRTWAPPLQPADLSTGQRALGELDAIARAAPIGGPDEQRVVGSRKPLKGMTDRVFRRLLTLHLSIESDSLLPRLLDEVQRNPDCRLGEKLAQYSKAFPRRKIIQTIITSYLESDTSFISYQKHN
jgi:hypothetical protein